MKEGGKKGKRRKEGRRKREGKEGKGRRKSPRDQFSQRILEHFFIFKSVYLNLHNDNKQPIKIHTCNKLFSDLGPSYTLNYGC
jgi:hypothetical protein